MFRRPVATVKLDPAGQRATEMLKARPGVAVDPLECEPLQPTGPAGQEAGNQPGLCAMSAGLSRSFARPRRTPSCAGCGSRRGDRAAMFYPSANRDETHFADPDRFDVESHAEPARGVRRRWNAFLPRCEPGSGRGGCHRVRRCCRG